MNWFDFAMEREVFLLLGQHRIAARCLHCDDTCRIEEFYDGRTLTPVDLDDSDVLKGIATELFRFHQLEPDDLPDRTFFELLHDKWGPLARAGHHLDCGVLTGATRSDELDRLVGETEDLIMLSDYMYAMAAIPLAVQPIQKIRFIPYAHARWRRFLAAYGERFNQHV
jgi:hypothetical protein